MNLPMTIEEIKKKIKNEVPLQTIADLNGLDLKTFEKIIRQYEEEHNEQKEPKDATLPKKAIEATLLAARRQHAAEVEKLHEAEASYKAAQDSEMGFRAIVLGLEMLLQKGALPND